LRNKDMKGVLRNLVVRVSFYNIWHFEFNHM
jgi:hypothetical protein